MTVDKHQLLIELPRSIKSWCLAVSACLLRSGNLLSNLSKTPKISVAG
ncbi:unnamed protein product [Acidithrix sp. C25]|nr:unnamed protein product [Acidithrix sp. C25]